MMITHGVYHPAMSTAKIFLSGRSQAVRLPKEFRFEGSEVYVARMGSAVVLMPQNHTWDVLFEACEGFSKDFMEDREKPKNQERNLTL
jgi:antitoxin VapB